jgi:hypothetical protein
MRSLKNSTSYRRLGNKLKDIIKEAKLILHKEVGNGNYTDEEIHQHALEIVKEHILCSSFTGSDYRRWREAEAVIDEMRDKHDQVLEQIEQLDAFIKNRTKPP